MNLDARRVTLGLPWWNQLLHEGGFLKPATYQRMTTPEGAAVAAGYGYGLYINTLRGQRFISHGGSHFGVGSSLSYLPSQRITVVLLRNTEGELVLEQMGRLLAAYAAGTPISEPPPIHLSPDQLKRFEGVYRQGAVTRTLRVVGIALTTQRGDGPLFTLIPIAAARFAFASNLTTVCVRPRRQRQRDGVARVRQQRGRGRAGDAHRGLALTRGRRRP